MVVYVQNFSTMELTSFLEKNQRLLLQIQAVILRLHHLKPCAIFFEKIQKIQDFMDIAKKNWYLVL
jgi:hypothetical protein